jgi:hypothetical protein
MPEVPEVPETRRRSPRYLRFLVSGGLVGVIVSLVLTVARAGQVEQPLYLFLYLGLLLGAIGALLGGLAAVLLEGRRRS